jgi:prevent-host-death family protein
MKKAFITVTEVARDLAGCINRARHQDMTLVLTKRGKAVARLVPEKKKRCSGRDLAEALAAADLCDEEARDWHRDLKAARKSIKP